MTEEQAEPAPAPKPRKSFGESLRSPAGETLRFTALLRKTGVVDTFVVQTTRDKKGEPVNKRGLSRQFTGPNASTEAEAHIAQLVADAKEAGWAGRAGGKKVARPDEFDAIPKPLPAPKGVDKVEPIRTAKKAKK